MPKESLPLKLDPFRFADNAATVQGVLFVKKMPRLLDSLSSDEGEVDVNLTFGVDEEKIRCVRGQYKAHLTLQCQRCMASFVQEIEGHFAYGIVHSEAEGERLPSRYDPVIAVNGMLHVVDMIEDELIISLPIVPMHALLDCKVKLPLAADSDVASDVTRENPFKVIELLRKQRESK